MLNLFEQRSAAVLKRSVAAGNPVPKPAEPHRVFVSKGKKEIFLPKKRQGAAKSEARRRVAEVRALKLAGAPLDRANVRGLVLGCIEAKFCK